MVVEFCSILEEVGIKDVVRWFMSNGYAKEDFREVADDLLLEELDEDESITFYLYPIGYQDPTEFRLTYIGSMNTDNWMLEVQQ